MDLTVSLLFLALPGLVARTTFRLLIGRREQKIWEDVIEIAVFSISAYVILAAVERDGVLLGILRSADAGRALEFAQIAWATGISVILSVAGSVLHKYRVITRLGVWAGVSTKFGDNDVWENFVRRHVRTHIAVRDHVQAVTYFGALRSFSAAPDDDGKREIVLVNVAAMRSETGEEVYRAKEVYLARDASLLTLETYAVPEEETSNGKR